jgi:hypothetical protein
MMLKTTLTRLQQALAPAAASLLTTVLAGPAAAQIIPEIQVTKTFILDFEFDWGRDGIYCATCNNGAGNARFAFTDPTGKLWVANIDPNTGAFLPSNGKGVLVDPDGAYAADFGNGPEWMFSAAGSQLVYTRYLSGTTHIAANAVLGLATPTANGGWAAFVVPNSSQKYSPLGSLDVNDPSPKMLYQNKADAKAYWRFAGAATDAVLPSNRPVCTRRWVPNTNAMVYTAPCFLRAQWQGGQVYWYDTDTGKETQITFDPATKMYAFVWRAPEFNNDQVLVTLANRTTLQVYRQVTDTQGNKTWTLINTIAAPASMPYVWSPEPFVHNGKSYVIMQLTSTSALDDYTVPTQLAMTGIDPAVPSLRMLTNDTSVQRLRMDPEYYITSQGAYVYYNRYFPATATATMQPEGVWRVDTGLGPPLH